MKKKGILSTFDGGHLDASLFRSKVPGQAAGDGGSDDDPTRFGRRKRFGRAAKKAASDRDSSRRKTHPGPGL